MSSRIVRLVTTAALAFMLMLPVAATLLLTPLLIPSAHADDEKAARLLILEAVKLRDQALPLLSRNPGHLFQIIKANPEGPFGSDLLMQAREKIQEVLDNYPTSDEGMALATGQTIYDLNVGELDRTIGNARQMETRIFNEIACVHESIYDIDDPRCAPLVPRIIEKYIEIGRTDDAIVLARDMENPNYAVGSLLITINMVIDDERYADAIAILQEAYNISQAHGLTGVLIQLIPSHFRRVAGGVAKTGDIATAKAYAQLIPDELVRTKTLQMLEEHFE